MTLSCGRHRQQWNSPSQKAHCKSESDTEDGVSRDRHEHEARRDRNVEHGGIGRHEHGEFESEGKQDSPSPMPPCPIADDRQS